MKKSSPPKTRSPALPGGSDSLSLFNKLAPITYVAIEELRSYARKLRKHDEKQMTKLMASISHFGFNVPLLVTPGGEIIAGEARLDAARRLGLTEVPTICIDHLTPAQMKAFRLADNRIAELADWNVEELRAEIEELITIDEGSIEIIGWDTAEIDVLLTDGAGSEAPVADPADEVVPPPATPVTRAGDLWRLGKHRLLCASSLDGQNWERLMDGQVAAMCFTDPPYNVSISGHVSGLGAVKHAEFAMASGEMSRPEFTTFLTQPLEQMTRHLADGAILHVCMDWRHLGELLAAGEAAGLSLINLCVWNKTNGGMGSLYRSKHELVLIFKKGRAPHINNVELGRHGRYRTNVWDYAGVNSFGKSRMTDLADHPTVKPIALVADAIRDVSRHGDIVVDAFMGSGTTLLAAQRTGRTAYGCEIDPAYVDVAIRRWQEMTGGQAVLDATGERFSDVAAERLADILGAEAA